MKAVNKSSTSAYKLTLTDSAFIPPVITPIDGNATRRREVVIPGALIKGDKVRPNPWNYTLQDWNFSDCSYNRKLSSTYSATYSGPTQAGQYTVLPDNLGREIDNCYNEALTKFNEKIDGSLNLTVDAIQASQTAGLLNAANRLVNRARLFRRTLKDPRKWRQATKEIGSMWLEWQYGWYPLVMTMHGLLDQMGSDGGSWVKPIRLGASRSPLLPKTAYFNTFGLPHLYQINGSCSIRCSMYGTIALTGQDPQKVASYNPAVIAWELLPLSFVADWMIGIGDYLSNVEAASKNAAQWRHGAYAITTKVNATCTTTDTAGAYVTFKGGFSTNYTQMSRITLPQYPSPRPPQLDVQLGGNRLLSAASLLAQLLK